MSVRPNLEHGTVAWNPYTHNNIDTLEKIQRSAARFTLNDHRRKTSVTGLINKLCWGKLKTPTHILLQNNTKPPEYHVTATYHKPMLPYTKQQSQQIHTNPRTHQCIRILFLPESHKSLELTPSRNHKQTDTTPIPINPQYRPPCCSSPPHQILA